MAHALLGKTGINMWKQIKGSSGFLLFSLISNVCFGVNPAATEQSILSIPKIIPAPQKHLAPAKKTPVQRRQEEIQEVKTLLNRPEFKQYILSLLKHPYFTSTAKSIYSPAAVPFQWGGVGLASDTISRYPTQHGGSAKTNFGAALPFGDSENSIGGVLSIGTAQLQPTTPPSSTNFGDQGSVGLAFSRWLLPSSMAIVGVANMIPWGAGSRAMGKSYYGALTQYMGIPFNHKLYALSTSVGLGTGSFGPYGAVNHAGRFEALSDRNATVFVNSALNLSPDVAVVGDYYSETFAIGLAYNNRHIIPLNLMLYVANLNPRPIASSTYVGIRVSMGVPFALLTKSY